MGSTPTPKTPAEILECAADLIEEKAQAAAAAALTLPRAGTDTGTP